jgi:positive regulator of sigma E activity
MKNPIKVMWFGIIINGLISLMQLGFLAGKLSVGNYWGALGSVFLFTLNAWAAWFVYSRLREYKATQQQKVVDILSGKYDHHFG